MTTARLYSAALAAGLLTLGACKEAPQPASESPAASPAGALPAEWEIPEPFRGEWHSDPSRCGDASDELRLVIGPAELNYHEAKAKVLASKASGTGITIVGEFTGEGMKWNRTIVFELSDDGQTLTSVEEGPASVRRKCPAG